MATYTIAEARQNLAEAVAKSAVEEVFLQKYGKNVAVMISTDVYERLIEAWEDIEDLKWAEEYSKTRADRVTIPMDEVFAKFNLDKK